MPIQLDKINEGISALNPTYELMTKTDFFQWLERNQEFYKTMSNAALKIKYIQSHCPMFTFGTHKINEANYHTLEIIHQHWCYLKYQVARLDSSVGKVLQGEHRV
jgi:hypothetical protein